MKARILIIALTLIAIGGCEQERETRCFTLHKTDGTTEQVEGAFFGYHEGVFKIYDRPYHETGAVPMSIVKGVREDYTSVAGPCPCEPEAPGKPREDGE